MLTNGGPKENLVGEEGQGWTIGKRLLQHERTNISGGGSLARLMGQSLGDIAKKYQPTGADGELADAVLRDKIADFEIRWNSFLLTARRAMEESKAAGGVSEISSVLKKLGTKLSQERSELLIEIRGLQGLGWEGDGFSDGELEAVRAWLFGKATTIYGGSTEIQNNIIAKRVLGCSTTSKRGEQGQWQFSTKNRKCCATWRATGSSTNARSPNSARSAPAASPKPSTATPMRRWRRWAGPGSSSPKSMAGRTSASCPRASSSRNSPDATASPLVMNTVARRSFLAAATSRRRWLPRLASSGPSPSPSTRAEPRSCRSRPVSDGKLSGTKAFVPKRMVRPVRRRGEGRAYLVEKGDGVALTTRKLTDQRSHADVTFDGAAAEKLANGGDSLLDDVLDRARVLTAAEMLGMAQQVFDDTLDYLKQRVQFNQVLASFQALQHRMADLFADLAQMRSAVEAGLQAVDGGFGVARAATIAKAEANALHTMANEGIQLHGGIGMTDEYAWASISSAPACWSRASVVELPQGPLPSCRVTRDLHGIFATCWSKMRNNLAAHLHVWK